MRRSLKTKLGYALLWTVFGSSILVRSTPAQPRPPIYLYGVGVPSTPRVRAGERIIVPLNVSVANTTASPAIVIVGARVEGIATESMSAAETIPPNGQKRFELKLDTDLTGMTLRPPSGELPGTLLLYIDRVEVHRFAFRIPIAPAAYSTIPSVIADAIRSDRDLSLDSVRVTAAGRRVQLVRLGETKVIESLSLDAVMRNFGRQAWGYRGELAIDMWEGTPEAGLHTLGAAGCTNCGTQVLVPNGFNIDESKHLPIVLLTGKGLGTNGNEIVAGRYYTATIRFESEFDQRTTNNGLYLTFRLNDRWGVAEQRTSAMPPSSNRITVR